MSGSKPLTRSTSSPALDRQKVNGNSKSSNFFGYSEEQIIDVIFKAKDNVYQLENTELVLLILLGIDVFKKKQSHYAASNLERYLNGHIEGDLILDISVIKKHKDILERAVYKHYYKIKETAFSRLNANDGELFPKEEVLMTAYLGGTKIRIEPKVSVLKEELESYLYTAGVYFEENLDESTNIVKKYFTLKKIKSDFYSGQTVSKDRDLFYGFGAVWFSSDFTLQAIQQENEWLVTIVDWSLFAWDHYNWERGSSTPFSVKLLFATLAELFPESHDDFNAIANDYGREIISVDDDMMNSINGQQITMPNGQIFHPKDYFIWFEGKYIVPLDKLSKIVDEGDGKTFSI